MKRTAEVVAYYESEVGRIDRDELVKWLECLPKVAKLEPELTVHNKLWIKASWTLVLY